MDEQRQTAECLCRVPRANWPSWNASGRSPAAGACFTAVNNTWIGLAYIGMALLFFVLAGVLALVMRTQLAVPGNDLVSPDTYNQLFTMHGSVMMFLFAIPVVEAVAVYPAAADARSARPAVSRDCLRLRSGRMRSAGCCSSGRSFSVCLPTAAGSCIRRLSSYEYSPGIGADFWLLGIGFIEISAIAGAIELVVGVLRTRPPGMSLGKMPVYAWVMLVVGVMIIFGFPPVIVGTLLLELERALHWPFFIADAWAAIRCCGSTCSGFSAIRRCTSSSCRPRA